MTSQSPSTGWTAAALIGAVLMFAGWLLVILPTLHHVERVWLVIVLAVVVFGLVLVPSSLDILTPARGGKRGAGTLAVSFAPAIITFLALVFVIPLGVALSALAIVVELAGMALFGWAWWRTSQR